MRALFLALVFCPTLAYAQHVGDKVMPKMEAKLIKETIEIPWVRISLPLTVKEIQDDWLRVGEGEIKCDHVVLVADALSYYSNYLKSNPDSSVAYNLRGFAWNDKGEYDNAIIDYTEVIRLDSTYASAFNFRGVAWDSKGEYGNAIKDFNEAIRLDPKYILGYYNRGNTWTKKGDYDNAIKDFTEAIRLDPKYVNAYNNRGLVWKNKREYDNAIKDFTEAIRLVPKYVNAYMNRGIASYFKHDYEQAIIDYSKAIEIDPKSASAYHFLGWVYATCPVAKHRNGRKAVRYATKACEFTDWNNGRYIVTMAAAYAEIDRFKQAMLELEKAAAISSASELELAGEMFDLFRQHKPYRMKN